MGKGEEGKICELGRNTNLVIRELILLLADSQALPSLFLFLFSKGAENWSIIELHLMCYFQAGKTSVK